MILNILLLYKFRFRIFWTRVLQTERMNSLGESNKPSASFLNFIPTLDSEKKLAQEIMDVVCKLQLPLKLDELTRGEGNCFPLAVLQQCKRKEIFSYIRPSVKRIVSVKDGHSVLRREVTKFIMTSKTQRISKFRTQYEETDGAFNNVPWNEYWTKMVTDKTWVDFWFIQATAWYLQLDMWIITTSSTYSSPYIEISGNLEECGIPFDRPILLLGTKSNCHYQSLLLIEMLSNQHYLDQATSVQVTHADNKDQKESANFCVNNSYIPGHKGITAVKSNTDENLAPLASQNYSHKNHKHSNSMSVDDTSWGPINTDNENWSPGSFSIQSSGLYRFSTNKHKDCIVEVSGMFVFYVFSLSLSIISHFLLVFVKI